MYYCLALYNRFVCIADKCPSTCCAGWKVRIDESSVRRFRETECEELREDILSNIVQENGIYYFRHRHDGSCAMLDGDGLCRIQKNLGEPSLCITCRKYPRLAARIGKDTWLSMAASCPVVAGYLWEERPAWLYRRPGQNFCLLSQESFLSEEMQNIRKEVQAFRERSLQDWHRRGKAFDSSGYDADWCRNSLKWYETALELAGAVAGLLTEYREQSYLEGSLDYFEREDITVQQILEALSSFETYLSERMAAFWQNYAEYRFYSRYMEQREETSLHRLCQVLGELRLFEIMCFSCYHSSDGWCADRAPEILCWLYRFCVHGNTLAPKVHQIFYRLFCDDSYLCEGDMTERKG